MHATADGHLVVLHDATVDRTTDGTGPVGAMTLAALGRLDAGHRFRAPDGTFPYRGRGLRVPVLEAVFEAFPGVPVNIEIKQNEPAIEAALLGTLDRCGARAQVLVAGEDLVPLARFRAAAPDVLTSLAAAEVAEFVRRLRGGGVADYRPPGVALQVPPAVGETEIVTPAFVAAAHALGLEVHVWTVNEPEEMERLLDLGVDALMTDFPGRALEVLRRRGVR